MKNQQQVLLALLLLALTSMSAVAGGMNVAEPFFDEHPEDEEEMPEMPVDGEEVPVGEEEFAAAPGQQVVTTPVDEESKEKIEQEKTTFETLIKQMQETLGDKVKEVRLTHRLTDSPACVVADEADMDFQMQRIMESMGQSFNAKPPILEINPEHNIVTHIHGLQDDNKVNEWTHVLFDQAILAEGGQLNDPANYVSRLNKLLLDVTKA